MPGACLNSWQTDACEWGIRYVWRSSDWIERAIFIALALMLAYTLFVLIRFSRRYYLARRESCSLVYDSWRAFQRSQRTIVAALSRGLRTLKAIASAAPFLGLAGTSYGILASLFRGFGMEKNAALRMLTVSIAATLISAAAGILVAIPAILAHNFLRTRIDRFEREFSSAAPAGMASHEDPARPGPRQFRLAQTLRLKKRFSSPPPFALIAAPALASVVAVFMAFEPYETPTGLDVRLLPIGSLDGDRVSPKPVVISIVAGANGSPVIRVNSREIPPNNLEEATRRELKLLAEPRVYVEAESTVAWADVTNVIDMMEGLNAEVVLLTATPDTSSR
jgi:biopolymer transport protein ExbD